MILLAPRERFELPTNGLTVRRSTTELPGNAEEARIVGKPGLQVKEGGYGEPDVSAETSGPHIASGAFGDRDVDHPAYACGRVFQGLHVGGKR